MKIKEKFFFGKRTNKESRLIRDMRRHAKSLETRSLQFMSSSFVPEGGKYRVSLESLMRSTNVEGTCNTYTTYKEQVCEGYNKFRNESEFGNLQYQACANFRTSLIGGESVSFNSPEHTDIEEKWIDDLLAINKMYGTRFSNGVLGGELTGQALFKLHVEYDNISLEPFVKIVRIPYNVDYPYEPLYKTSDPDEEPYAIKFCDKNGDWEEPYDRYVYQRLYGDDTTYCPNTPLGAILTSCENYDRATKDMRRTNHVTSRITPTFNCKTKEEATSLRDVLTKLRWKIGQVFIGTAEMAYKSPSSSALENLVIELVSLAKTISSVTGVPMHWQGFVDTMSNRATAKELYEMIKHATLTIRNKWAEIIKNIIIKAQTFYILSGGRKITRVSSSLEVKLPLIDFSQFVDRVSALSTAYGDNAISLYDYRSSLPGIDPYKTEKQVKKEAEENLASFKNNSIPGGISYEE